MESRDLSKELYREYKWIDPVTGTLCWHRIDEPDKLFVGETTHRIVEQGGLVHFVPAIGYFGCVLYTMNKDLHKPVNF